VHPKIEQAMRDLTRARDEYERQLSTITGLLQIAVSADPAHLEDALEIQSFFAAGEAWDPPVGLTQP
jgi:hypothetical protein